MRTILRNIWVFTLLFAVVGVTLTGCEDDDLPNGGNPIVHYVRVTNPNASDSLLAGAFLGNLVAIMGDNLGGLRELYFNDRKAALNPNYITDKTVIVNVPSAAPIETTDKILMKFKNGKELSYDFVVRIPPPAIHSMDLEYVEAGESAFINGQYFFDVTPLKVQFSTAGGGWVDAVIVGSTEDRIEVTVPAEAASGPIVVTTNFGRTESVLHFRDQRNIVLNYDDPGKTPTGAWRNGIFVEDHHSITGKYIFFKGIYTSPERTEGEGSPYESQFWAQVSGRQETQILPGEPSDYVMKFEAKVIEWYGSYLNLCFAPYEHSGSNQEIWSNNFNARAIWGPWDQKDAMYSTEGKWITVTIPMTEFKWAMGMGDAGVEYTEMKFNKNVTGSLSLWVLSAPKADKSPFEFYIDNVRVVPNK